MIEAGQMFPEILLVGDARQRGHAHGEQLRDSIHQVLDYYRTLFRLSDADLRREATEFGHIIKGFSGEYAQEIESCAAAANLDAVYLYALNSRSEILNNVDVAECTAVMHSGSALLAQNWDWSEALEELVVLIRLQRPDNPTICMLTEPGIIGKIGMNSAGIGACLNILRTTDRLRGLPVHVLLRAVLDSTSMAEVRALMNLVNVGKASHVLVGDAAGACLSVEFSGIESFQLEPDGDLLLHTNHYLSESAANTAEAFPSTHERLQQAQAMLAADSSPAGLLAMLRDQSQGELSICRPYSLSEATGFGRVGSVFTVMMDLAEREMQVYRGPAEDARCYRVVL
jgi:isopenicillin-N N-acyltransferase-like protein